MSQAENDLLTAYNQFVDFNPSFKGYVTMMGFRTRYRSAEELGAFAGRILAKKSTFKIESKVLVVSFVRQSNTN